MEELEKRIGYVFNDKKLLKRALTHRSYTNENVGSENNERLEFLGDAILQYVCSDYLFKNYPEEQEGVLTIYRSILVSTESLIESSELINISEFILLSAGQKKDIENKKPNLIADAIEALIAAIYLDGGYEASEAFIQKIILFQAKEHIALKPMQDSKTRFQEVAQKELNVTPTYLLVKESGPDHEKMFVVAVYIGDKRISSGDGKTKQEAERSAAEKALLIKGW